jgi:microfibrillar-associated protein 1
MSSSSDSEAAARRRRTIARALAIQKAADSNVQTKVDSSSSESSSSESSSSSSDNEQVRLKPVFISKSKRVGPAAESSDNGDTEKDDHEFLLKQREQVLEAARLQEQIESGIKEGEKWSDMQPKAPPLPEYNTEENYQKWKVRELKRILKFRMGTVLDEPEAQLESSTESGKKAGVFFRS